MQMHVVYMVLYAFLVGLSMFNLYAQIPRAWQTPVSGGALISSLVRSGLVAWIAGSTGLVLVTVARWLH